MNWEKKKKKNPKMVISWFYDNVYRNKYFENSSEILDFIFIQKFILEKFRNKFNLFKNEIILEFVIFWQMKAKSNLWCTVWIKKNQKKKKKKKKMMFSHKYIFNHLYSKINFCLFKNPKLCSVFFFFCGEL